MYILVCPQREMLHHLAGPLFDLVMCRCTVFESLKLNLEMICMCLQIVVLINASAHIVTHKHVHMYSTVWTTQ